MVRRSLIIERSVYQMKIWIAANLSAIFHKKSKWEVFSFEYSLYWWVIRIRHLNNRWSEYWASNSILFRCFHYSVVSYAYPHCITCWIQDSWICYRLFPLVSTKRRKKVVKNEIQKLGELFLPKMTENELKKKS